MITRQFTQGDTQSVALYSECEAYRYSLTRAWRAEGPRVAFVMLNPSTATEERNDPTIERCERRARAMGYGAFRVTNLFAWRATVPRDLKAAAEPVGADNDAVLLESARWAEVVIAGWGVHGAHLARGPQVAAMLRGAGARLCHLGLTKEGHPRHPLYVPYARGPLDWD